MSRRKRERDREREREREREKKKKKNLTDIKLLRECISKAVYIKKLTCISGRENFLEEKWKDF